MLDVKVYACNPTGNCYLSGPVSSVGRAPDWQAGVMGSIPVLGK